MAHIAKKLNRLVTIEQAFEKELGIKVTAGQSICCPFHNDKTPSMKVYGGDKGAYCFGQCGKTYTPYSTIKYNNPELSYKDLLFYIKTEYGVESSFDDEDDNYDGYTSYQDEELAKRYVSLGQGIKPAQFKKLEISINELIDNNNIKFLDRLTNEVFDINEDIDLEL